LPITDKADVWGHAVALLELYSGRVLVQNGGQNTKISPAKVVNYPYYVRFHHEKWGFHMI